MPTRSVTVIQRDSNVTRVETGVVQFGDDWPGIFLRGDETVSYAFYLDKAIHGCDMEPMAKYQLSELSKLLGSCLEECGG